MSRHHHGYIFRDKSDKAINIVSRDMQAVSPSYTRTYGFVMSHGAGAEVWDVDGNKYIDFAAGIAVLSTGHRHPKIVKAIHDQTEKYLHIGATDFFCPQQIELAEKLQQISPINGSDNPEDVMIYFGNSGTEAVEAALKLARYRTSRRSHIIAFYGGFHGRTMGSLSVTASKAVQRASYPFVPGGVDHVPYPAKSASEESRIDSVRFIEEFIVKKKTPGDEIAAVIVEPIQGEGGYIMPRDEFLGELRAFCDKYGILLIADEIQSGMGRSGRWFAIEHWGVKPDIICSAKGLGSGLPIGATIAHKDVMGIWQPGAHASTFGGNPLACAVASATIDVILEEGLLDHVSDVGAFARSRLERFMSDHPSISRVEGIGFMIGLDFENADGNPLPAFRDEVVNRCFLSGLITLGCGAAGLRLHRPSL